MLDEEKSKFPLKLLLIVAVVILLTASSIAGYFFFTTKKTTTSDSNLETEGLSGREEETTPKVSFQVEGLSKTTNTLNTEKQTNYAQKISGYLNNDNERKFVSRAGTILFINGIFDEIVENKTVEGGSEGYLIKLESYDHFDTFEVRYSKEQIEKAKVHILGTQGNPRDISWQQIRKGQMVSIKEVVNFFDDFPTSNLFIEVKNSLDLGY